MVRPDSCRGRGNAGRDVPQQEKAPPPWQRPWIQCGLTSSRPSNADIADAGKHYGWPNAGVAISSGHEDRLMSPCGGRHDVHGI